MEGDVQTPIFIETVPKIKCSGAGIFSRIRETHARILELQREMALLHDKIKEITESHAQYCDIFFTKHELCLYEDYLVMVSEHKKLFLLRPIKRDLFLVRIINL